MAKVIAVVGAGGKTTRIHNLTKQYREEGKRVLVTTTTHMYREEGCILSGNVEEIIQRLDTCGYCMAGLPAEDGKMKGLLKEVYEKVCDFAEVVLVEADGSKGYPVKYPADHSDCNGTSCHRMPCGESFSPKRPGNEVPESDRGYTSYKRTFRYAGHGRICNPP